METKQTIHKQELKKVYRYGSFDIKYAIKRELKFRGQLVGEMFKEIAVHTARNFVL